MNSGNMSAVLIRRRNRRDGTFLSFWDVAVFHRIHRVLHALFSCHALTDVPAGDRRISTPKRGNRHGCITQHMIGFLDTEAEGSSWIFKPHAQISSVSIDADSFADSHGTWYGDNQGSGIQSRLGARLHGPRAAGQTGISPFAELNWLYSDVDNAIRLDGTKTSSTIGRNVGEFKAGRRENSAKV